MKQPRVNYALGHANRQRTPAIYKGFGSLQDNDVSETHLLRVTPANWTTPSQIHGLSYASIVARNRTQRIYATFRRLLEINLTVKSARSDFKSAVSSVELKATELASGAQHDVRGARGHKRPLSVQRHIYIQTHMIDWRSGWGKTVPLVR